METVIAAPFPAKVREVPSGTSSPSRPARRWCGWSRSGTAKRPRSAGSPTPPRWPASSDSPFRPTRWSPPPPERGVRCLEDVRALMLLGFDLGAPDDARRALMNDYLQGRAGRRGGPAARRCGTSSGVFSAFADMAELGRNRPAAEEGSTATVGAQPARALPCLPAQPRRRPRASCPRTFRERLARVLSPLRGRPTSSGRRRWRRPSSGSSSRSSAAAPELGVITALVQQWLTEPPPDDGAARRCAATCSTGWCCATQLRFPVVGDLARNLRFRWFDQPMVRGGARRACSRASATSSAYLAANPDAADRADRIDALATIPEQIVRFLGRAARRPASPRRSRCSRCSPAGTTASTSCTICALRRRAAGPSSPPTTRSTTGRPSWSRRSAPWPSSSTSASRAGHRRPRQLDARPAGNEAVIDLYLHLAGGPPSGREGLRAAAGGTSERSRSPAAYAGSRSSCAGRGNGRSSLRHLPARPDGVVEDELIRGVHPMVGHRLNLWRLRDFGRVTRLATAPEDVLLYHCVAPRQPRRPAARRAGPGARADAVVRDAEGHGHRAARTSSARWTSCLEAIRRARGRSGAAGPGST